MAYKQHCEICKGFGQVGFTDCGLICEGCFRLEVAKADFNAGVEAAAKLIEKENISVMQDYAREIRLLKKKMNTKEESKP